MEGLGPLISLARVSLPRDFLGFVLRGTGPHGAGLPPSPRVNFMSHQAVVVWKCAGFFFPSEAV